MGRESIHRIKIAEDNIRGIIMSCTTCASITCTYLYEQMVSRFFSPLQNMKIIYDFRADHMCIIESNKYYDFQALSSFFFSSEKKIIM